MSAQQSCWTEAAAAQRGKQGPTFSDKMRFVVGTSRPNLDRCSRLKCDHVVARIHIIIPLETGVLELYNHHRHVVTSQPAGLFRVFAAHARPCGQDSHRRFCPPIELQYIHHSSCCPHQMQASIISSAICEGCTPGRRRPRTKSTACWLLMISQIPSHASTYRFAEQHRITDHAGLVLVAGCRGAHSRARAQSSVVGRTMNSSSASIVCRMRSGWAVIICSAAETDEVCLYFRSPRLRERLRLPLTLK